MLFYIGSVMSLCEHVRKVSNSIKGREFLSRCITVSISRNFRAAWSERRELLKTAVEEKKAQIGLQLREKRRIFNVFCKVKLQYCTCTCLMYFIMIAVLHL
jgi:hypothetical protein